MRNDTIVVEDTVRIASDVPPNVPYDAPSFGL